MFYVTNIWTHIKIKMWTKKDQQEKLKLEKNYIKERFLHYD